MQEDNIVRQFKCRPGINILWSKPEPFDEGVGLYGDGVSGHSTGKTLFCRILRGLLGEKHFGPDDTKDRLAAAFDELWAVAKIRLNGQSWIVGRCLTEGISSSFAEQSEDETEVLEKETRGSFISFTDELDRIHGAITAPLVNSEPWLHLLECLSRDQEARFSSLTKWRDASAGSTGFQMSKQDRHAILRILIGALDPDEFRLRSSISETEKQLKYDQDELLEVATRDKSNQERLKELYDDIPEITLDLEDLAEAARRLESAIEVRQQAVNEQAELGRSPATEALENELEILQNTKSKADTRTTELSVTIPAKELQLTTVSKSIELIQTKDHSDPKRADEHYCPRGILYAREKGCLEDPSKVDPLSLKELEELQADEKTLPAEITRLKNEQADLAKKLPTLISEEKRLQKALNKQRLDDLGNLAKQQILLPRLRDLKRLLVAAELSSTTHMTKLDLKTKSENRIQSSKERIRLLREDQQSNLFYLSDIISDLIRALMGKDTKANLNLLEEGLVVNAWKETGVRKTRLSGAALESIKAITLDLAMVIQGIEGKSQHPRILIHDGPREADMARVVYERFFLYLLKMEAAFATRPPAFQYFLTTTTPPPSNMRDGTDFLICPPLSGMNDESKLLGRSF